MKPMFLIGASAAILTAASASSAQAQPDRCRSMGTPSTFLLQNSPTVSWSYSTTAGTPCFIQITPGPTVTYRNAEIVGRPRAGTLRMTKSSGNRELGGPRWDYQPRRGFTGADAFIVRACGVRPEGQGCATINITVQVQ
jgi:hypothetical protein